MAEVLPLVPADPNRIATLSRLTQELLGDRTRVPVGSRAQEAIQSTRVLLDDYPERVYGHIAEKLISYFELIQEGPTGSDISEQLAGPVFRALLQQFQAIDFDLEYSQDARLRSNVSAFLAHLSEAVSNDRVITAAARAQQAVADAASVAGITSLGELESSTSAQQELEVRAARWTRVFAIAALIGSVVSAAFLISRPPDSWYAAISHYGITFSLVLLSGYLARESAQHRFVSRELHYHQERIRSLLTFSNSFEDSDQRADFLIGAGRTLFTTPFAQPGGGRTQGLPSDQLESLLAKIAEIVKSARSAD